MIYHIVLEKDYLPSIKGDSYIPSNFNVDGFVHCALEVSVITVANDYYSNTEDRLLLLKLDPKKLKSQTKYEPAMPGKGAGTRHISTSVVFPHIYGPIEHSAVDGIGVLRKEKTGYVWPQEFVPLSEYVE